MYTEGGEDALSKLALCMPDETFVYTILHDFNGWQLAKMKKSIPDMSLPWNL